MVSVDHDSLLALVWTCFSVALLFVALRTAIRIRVASRLTADDYWITFALAALLTLCILETIQEPSLAPITGIMDGTGIQDFNSLIADTEHYLRYQFPIIVLFWTVLWSVKAGFLALYFKFFRELKHYRRAWFALALFTFLAYLGCIVTLTLSCGHPTNFFRFAQCGRPEQIWASNLSVYYSTSVDVFTDLCIMAMPLRLIYNLKQITMKQKLGLTCVFGLCFVMIAFSIVRAKQVLVPQHFVNLTLLIIWSTLTASISVIVGSLPAFKVFLTNRSTARSRYGSSNNRENQNTGFQGKGVALSPLPSAAKSPAARSIATSDSQEKMLPGDSAQSVSATRGSCFVGMKNSPGHH